MRMLLSVVVMVIVVVVVKSHLSPDSHLYDECVVKRSRGIVTFEDSVKFWFARDSDEDLTIWFNRRKDTFLKNTYKNLTQHEWIQAEMKLTSAPELYIQGRLHRPTENLTIITTTRTNLHIYGGDILLQCPQGWPNRELSSLESDVLIPSSGKEESLVLTPTVDTKVNFSVSGNKRTLCWNSGSGVTIVDGEMARKCGDLWSNSAVTLKFLFEDHNVKVLDAYGRQLDFFTFQGVRDLKFLREGLKGTVYIAQCIGNCTTGTAQDNDVTALLKIILQRFTEIIKGGPADSTPGYDSPWLISVSIFFIVLITFNALIIAFFLCSIFKKL